MNYHFQEEVRESGLSFNSGLLIGPSKERNARRLPPYAGYPPEIIEAAERRIQAGLML